MHVQIALESPYNVYTNLDVIRGKVILRLQSATPLTSLNVKLEGEARTRLMSPGNKEGGERPRPVEETHKRKELNETLYATHTQYHVLPPGLHEYPFEFKLPFNNSCSSSTASNNLSFGGLSLQMAKASTKHVKSTLPPTLTAFPGMCEIRYYLKVTVNRKEFYKENPRVYQPFNFIPIEPPRPPPSTSENYARRQHQFTAGFGAAGPSKLKSMFTGSKEKSSAPPSPIDSDAPKVSLDARIPEPAILTCNQDIPLRLILKRTNENSERLYLQSLQIELIGHTAIRAFDVFRNETNSWVIASHSNMNVLMDPGTDPEKTRLEKEILIDPRAWAGKPLPNSVAPSFDACNITRRYDLEVRVGIGYGSNSIKNLVILPLRLPVSVYSGIHPPAALLQAMNRNTVSGQANRIPRKQAPTQSASNVVSSPVGSSSAGLPAAVPIQPQPPSLAPMPHGPDEGIEEPPPTYEEALAEDTAPIDGPRNYQPPPVVSGGFPVDEKR